MRKPRGNIFVRGGIKVSLGKGPKKKLRKFGHMSKLWVGRVFLSHTFSKKKVWTYFFRVGRSNIDVHTYKNMQNPKHGICIDILDCWLNFSHSGRGHQENALKNENH